MKKPQRSGVKEKKKNARGKTKILRFIKLIKYKSGGIYEDNKLYRRI